MKSRNSLANQSDRPEISVVIPIYNGKKYIRQTLDAIICQTFKSFEVICVNDSSVDNSLSILKEYEAQDSRVRVFSTPSNLGIAPKVIKYAIPYIRGEYYVYSSQDDLFSEDWLEKMFSMAVETDADAVVPDLVFFFENESSKNTSLIGVNGNRTVVLSNREAVILSLDWIIPGNALWKTRIIKKVGYYDFGMNADDYTARIFFFNCNKVVFSEGVFYYRQDNPEAITKKLTAKSFDMPFTDFMLWRFLRENQFQADIQEKVLMKALSGLIVAKMVFIERRLRIVSAKDQLEGADKRIKKVFYCLNDSVARDALRNRKGIKGSVKVLAVSYSYGIFSFLCYIFVFFSLIKRAFKHWSLKAVSGV